MVVTLALFLSLLSRKSSVKVTQCMIDILKPPEFFQNKCQTIFITHSNIIISFISDIKHTSQAYIC